MSEYRSTYQPKFDGLLCLDSIKIRRVVFYYPKPLDVFKRITNGSFQFRQVSKSRVRKNMQESTCPTNDVTLSVIDSKDIAALSNQQ